jgi:4-diphosphocytidyl-2-C-methyl-D-erythritol kinase
MKSASEKSCTRLTLALDIVGKITSGPLCGYHELSILKHRIGLFDTITVEEAPATRVVCADPRVPLDGKNICVRALEAIKKATGVDKNATIVIEKNIPVMGGLAGGSANAATALRLFNSLWDLGLTDAAMMDIGRSLGMDVPYFFSGKTAFDTEAGGVLEPVATSCSFNFLLVIPPFGVSTAEAYGGIDYAEINGNRTRTLSMREALRTNRGSEAIKHVHNDFELSVFRRHPELETIKKRLLDLGCAGAAMTGSGSTMYGIVESGVDLDKIKTAVGHMTIAVQSIV